MGGGRGGGGFWPRLQSRFCCFKCITFELCDAQRANLHFWKVFPFKSKNQETVYIILLKTWEKQKLYLVSERHDKIVNKNLRTFILVHTFVQVDVHFTYMYPPYLHANTVYQINKISVLYLHKQQNDQIISCTNCKRGNCCSMIYFLIRWNSILGDGTEIE